jgi:predicted  nucleic acid-binding Zn-ribbon protein
MKGNNKPEDMNNLPNFITVIFDENGKPIGARPAKNPPVSGVPNTVEPNGQLVNRPTAPPVLVVNKDLIERLLTYVNRNTESLRVELRQSNFTFQKMLQDIKFNGQNQVNGSFLNVINPLKEKIENLEKIVNLQTESNQIINKKVDCLSAYVNDLSKNMKEIKIDGDLEERLDNLDIILENLSINMKKVNGIQLLSEKLDTLGAHFDELMKKISEINVDPLFGEKLEDMKLKLSNMVKEIAETKSTEMVTVEALKSVLEKVSILNQEIKDQKLATSTFGEKFDSIERGITIINENVLQNDIKNQQMISGIGEKLNGFSEIKDELNSIKAQTNGSIKELEENQRQLRDLLVNQEQALRTVEDDVFAELRENQKQIKNLMVNQEQISKDLTEDAVLRVQKMFKKPKRKVIRPQKSKVVKFLKKNFRIKPFNKVLVITDKRNSVFGKTLHEATRAVSKKSIFVVMENRTDKSALDKPVIEAIKKSKYVFMVGKYSLPKVKRLSKKLRNRIKIFSVRRTLNYLTL